MCAEPYIVTVVFASNARGMLPLSVAAWSVAEQARASTACDICILSDAIPEAQQESLRALIRRAGDRHRVRFIEIDRMLPEGLNVVGVVLEHVSHEGSHFNERLDIPQSCLGYFNSGVLLMDLDVFRAEGLGQRVVDFAQAHRDVLTCPDQDALNGALRDRLTTVTRHRLFGLVPILTVTRCGNVSTGADRPHRHALKNALRDLKQRHR